MEPSLLAFYITVLVVIGIAFFIAGSKKLETKSVSSSFQSISDSVNRSSLSPVIRKNGRLLRRKRRDGSAYNPADNIFDDLLYMDYFLFLDEIIHDGEDLCPEEYAVDDFEEPTVEMRVPTSSKDNDVVTIGEQKVVEPVEISKSTSSTLSSLVKSGHNLIVEADHTPIKQDHT